MTAEKRIQIDPAAIKARLEKNKEKNTRSSKREMVSLADNPILKVEKAGEYLFRATYDPHSSDPAAEPFRQRSYHYGIPGVGIVYCPQENDGEPCALCDFCWDEMKNNKGNKPKVKFFANKLPKMTVWIPGKMRTREEEGPKLLKIGTQKDKMSKNHEKVMEWFFKKSTANWLDPAEGFDMILKYEEYDAARAKELNAKFGLKEIDLERDESEFGGDFDAFMKSIPDIDNSDDQVLKAYAKKTSDDAAGALKTWLKREDARGEKLEKQAKAKSSDSDVDTSSNEDVSQDEEVSEDDAPAKSALQDKLAKLGIKV